MNGPLARLGLLGRLLDHQRLIHTVTRGNVTVAFTVLSYAGLLTVTGVPGPRRPSANGRIRTNGIPARDFLLRCRDAAFARVEAGGTNVVSKHGVPNHTAIPVAVVRPRIEEAS
ncbi:hypothetical protein [Nonomuraea sp. KM90]|uniref:hypothetical protein n=1 Tax=Nonomuraea sp. KM90 TaxID=3457428 RepID=UPI003FCD27F0